LAGVVYDLSHCKVTWADVELKYLKFELKEAETREKKMVDDLKFMSAT